MTACTSITVAVVRRLPGSPSHSRVPLRSRSGTEGWPGAVIPAITAVVIGGTRLEGGRGSSLATLGGVVNAARKPICEEMQRVAMDELPSIPLGCFYSNTALRRDLADRVPGPSLFWNIRRA